MESLFLVHSADCVQELNIRSKKFQMMVYTSTESGNLVVGIWWWQRICHSRLWYKTLLDLPTVYYENKSILCFCKFSFCCYRSSTLSDQFRRPGMSHSWVLAEFGELQLGLKVQWRQALKNNMAARAEAVSREGLFVSVSCPRSDTCAHSSLGTPLQGVNYS